MKKPNIALVRASLPSYFPERHQVWTRAEAALSELCSEQGANLLTCPDIPMNAYDTARVLDWCRSESADFILLLHGGFTMGDVARELAGSEFRLGFWSVPEPVRTGDIQLNNFVSLNMSMSISRLVRNLKERPVQWYHAAPETAAFAGRFTTTLRALRMVKNLSGAQIGSIGGLAMTFYNMEVDSHALFTRLGVRVHHHDMHELTGRMQAQEASRVKEEMGAMTAAASCEGVSDQQMELCVRCALALADIAGQGNAGQPYDALSVSDWPALQLYPGMHPGAAFSWLEEKHRLPVASEGDILGALTQLAGKALTGRVGYLLDMTEPDFDTGQMLAWHGGGGPLYLADERGTRWINHPMIGRGTQEGPVFGTISDLVFAKGPVSLLRISRNADAFFSMTGKVVTRDPSGFDGCRGWLEDFEIDGQPASLGDLVNTVMAHGLEHHFILIPGHFHPELSEFSSWSGMEQLGLKAMRSHLDSRDFT